MSRKETALWRLKPFQSGRSDAAVTMEKTFLPGRAAEQDQPVHPAPVTNSLSTQTARASLSLFQKRKEVPWVELQTFQQESKSQPIFPTPASSPSTNVDYSSQGCVMAKSASSCQHLETCPSLFVLPAARPCPSILLFSGKIVHLHLRARTTQALLSRFSGPERWRLMVQLGGSRRRQLLRGWVGEGCLPQRG